MKSILGLILAALLAGCTHTRYVQTTKDGSATFERFTLGTKQTIPELVVETDEAGALKKVVMRGHTSDPSEAVDATKKLGGAALRAALPP